MILRACGTVEGPTAAADTFWLGRHLIAMFRVSHLAVLMAVLGATVVLAQPQPPVALDALGPQPGTVVPAFSAVDQTGATRTLASIMGRRGAMLVFSRSADW
jgi:cytochrome c oxidase assembly factor CtaG